MSTPNDTTLAPQFGPMRHAPRIRATLRLWLDLWSERDSMARLDDDILRDIGVAPAAARREAGRMFWDVPPGRA